jgi:hypothetical protein
LPPRKHSDVIDARYYDVGLALLSELRRLKAKDAVRSVQADDGNPGFVGACAPTPPTASAHGE